MAKIMFKKNKENNSKKVIFPRVFRADNKESFHVGLIYRMADCL